MKWTDIDKTPHAVNQNGEVRIIGEVGQGPGFLWLWVGDQGIRSYPGGVFESTSATAGQINIDGKPVAFIATIDDTPEILDVNEANGEFAYLRGEVPKEYHVDFIGDQVRMIENGLAAKK